MIKKYKNYGKIRIIGGNLKGSILSINKIIKARPTTNYMRETLFNWISPYIKNSNCLDCFAGSGALSIESISRGANSVTSLENNQKNFFIINNNIIKLKIQNKINLIYFNTLHWLKKKKYILRYYLYRPTI